MKSIIHRPKYLLLDANVVVAYYFPKASKGKTYERIHKIVSAIRVRGRQKKPFVLFVPNFCVAEVFNAFRKHRYGRWNKQVAKSGGVISKNAFEQIYRNFQQDIRNGRLFYHYELSRYHLLYTALISPIDHHYACQRRGNPRPMQTFDLLIGAMGMELVRLHGRDSVYMLTGDSRLVKILQRTDQIKKAIVDKLDLDKAARLVGRNRFTPSLYPKVFNLSRGSDRNFNEILS